MLFGQGDETDYDAESGDDIMGSGASVFRYEGMYGFDWAIGKGDNCRRRTSTCQSRSSPRSRRHPARPLRQVEALVGLYTTTTSWTATTAGISRAAVTDAAD